MTDENLLPDISVKQTGLTRKAPSGSLVSSRSFWLGVSLIIFCGGLDVTYIAEIITGETRHGVSSQLGLITFMAGLVFVGWKLVEAKLREGKAWKELREEQLILSRAKTNGGTLTVSETALESGISILDAKKAFERLSLSGVCQVDVTDEGELCYNFPSLRLKLDMAEKQYQSIDIKQVRQFESNGS
ncbi:hypothetical protein KF728_01680 [Candidatus Obscuribacterales bacterium]|nr:hypothetical protein [Candidatus Obscuribacterales bacterium]MBX3148837.1 hypothetical protein [Candidatus Obscuribacterales bacterium]